MGATTSAAFDGTGTGVFPGGAGIRTITVSFDWEANSAIDTYTIATIPQGASIIGGHCYVDEAFTGGAGAAIAIESLNPNDIITSAVVAGAPWSTTGRKAITPKINTPETTSIIMTADTDVVVNVSGNTLTAGTLTLHLIVMNAL